MKYIWIEIIKFFKKNLIKLMVGTFFITLAYIGFSYLTTVNNVDTNIEEIESEEDGFRPDARPANFYYFVEHSDGTPFTNNLLVEQYITSSAVIHEASMDTDTNLNEIVEKTDNKAIVNYNESGESKVIGIYRNSNTYLQEFYINVGNEQNNRKIANYFYDLLINEEIPFLDNKNIYVFQRPNLKDINNTNSLENSSGIVDTSYSNNLVRDVLTGVIVGLVIMIGTLTLITLISEKLKYTFSYTTGDTDYLFLIDNKLDYKDELKQILTQPDESKIVVLNEQKNIKLNDEFRKIFNNNIDERQNENFTNILEVEDLSRTDRIIYIIEEGITSRAWYNKQRKLGEPYNIPTVIIQVNQN